ncbi:MAG: tetratricopeptide repeat protein [Acidobacteriota bacterium]|nr:tetratricopeptide repeat protein [Acidobacteriota bacterium]
MRTLGAIACSLLGATIFSVVLAAAHWQGRVRVTESVLLGLLAVLGFLIMWFGYRLQRSIAMVVVDVAVIGLLLGLIYPAFRSTAAPIMQAVTRSRIADVSKALAAYEKAHGSYPMAQSIDDLARQLEPTYIKQMPRDDVWLNAFRYEVWTTPDAAGAGHYAIASAGKNGKFEKASLRQYAYGPTSDFDCDIVMSDGQWIAFPDGPQAYGGPAVKPEKDPKALFDQATSLYRQEHYGAAIPLFELFLKNNPDHALANARLGISLCDVNRYNDAIPYLQKAIALDPTDYQSRSNLGLAYEKLGKPEEGIEWERKAVALQPDNPEVLNNLGWVLMQAKHNAEALKVFERTVRLAPTVKLYRDNLQRARSAAAE